MAALCPGVQYGLSSQQNFGENKDLIFVKLTDSALRAIEEYVKNQNKFNCRPTIKFLGNENGEISFPSVHHDSGNTSFSFSMSSTADMEGPGGSFECIQQNGSPRGHLESLGSIPHKIRIHANEDVYEATRNRMTEAEDKYKNKCTREIKPNQTDIGRKVKVKQTVRPIAPPVRREVPSMRDSLLKSTSYLPAPAKPPMVHSTTPLSSGLSNAHVSSSRMPVKKPSVPDIARRPLKERLIHLLALRPFKKVELHDRLIKEGLRERCSVTSVLKQISNMKDNCFHLNRSMWNEVQEDWPFYTETEKQMLKRRKPQNLTPPGSSDGGSSGSGQSPTSTHPGSPPPPITTPKRPGCHDVSDGFPYKRQRIAHGNKALDNASRPPVENNSQRRPVTDLRDASNMNPRSRESPTGNLFRSYTMLNEEEDKKRQQQPCDSHVSLSFNGSRNDKTFRSNSPVSNMMTEEARREMERTDNGVLNGERTIPNKIVMPTPKVAVTRVSPDSQSDRTLVGEELTIGSEEPPPKIEKENEFPDYQKEFVTITSPEQKRKYKEAFNTDYAEYKDLYPVVERVSNRFAELEEQLKQADYGSNRHKAIKRMIVMEYREHKKDQEHQRIKRRWRHLHAKLSHIKRLVAEYDQKMASDGRY